MITLKKPKNFKHWLALYRLYLQAFPKAERKPWRMIRKMYRLGRSDVWYAMEGSRFAGLAITINSPDVILVDYLAVSKHHRNRGIGGQILTRMKEYYPGKGLFLEIENPYAHTPDQALRQRRKAFYLRCGFTPMQVMVYLFGVEMELLGMDCSLNFEQYQAFYRNYYNDWAAEHIAPSTYPN